MPATERKPWYGPELVPQGILDVAVQAFNDVDTKFGSKRYASCDLFVDMGLLLSRTENTSYELELLFADTRHRTFGLDSVKLTGAYLWLDDVIGDPISLSTGVTATSVFKQARHDLAVFHHGGIEGEIFASVGREAVCSNFWTWRWWGVAGVGLGDIGSPWVRGDFHCEWNWWNCDRLDVFLETLWGLGGRDVHSVHHFHGYGPIEHHSVDVGGAYTRVFDYGIELKMQYSFRAYAKNCPENASIVLVHLLYPFSL
jgi:hypothetical protein